MSDQLDEDAHTYTHAHHTQARTHTHTHTNRLITILRKTNDEIDKNTSRHENNALIFARGLKAPPRLWIDITTLGSQILITIPSGTALSVTMWKTSIFDFSSKILTNIGALVVNLCVNLENFWYHTSRRADPPLQFGTCVKILPPTQPELFKVEWASFFRFFFFI